VLSPHLPAQELSFQRPTLNNRWRIICFELLEEELVQSSVIGDLLIATFCKCNLSGDDCCLSVVRSYYESGYATSAQQQTLMSMTTSIDFGSLDVRMNE
jgi:hypothetical protein